MVSKAVISPSWISLNRPSQTPRLQIGRGVLALASHVACGEANYINYFNVDYTTFPYYLLPVTKQARQARIKGRLSFTSNALIAWHDQNPSLIKWK